MTTRTAPSTAELVDLLRDRLDGDTGLVLMRDATRLVRAVYRTTLPKATEWLEQASLEQGDLLHTYITETGRVSGLLMRNNGSVPKIHPLVIASLTEAFPDAGGAYLEIKVDQWGKFDPKGSEWSKERTPALALRSTLLTMLDQATQVLAEKRVAQEAERTVEREAFDLTHPGAIKAFASLLRKAGITPTTRSVSWHSWMNNNDLGLEGTGLGLNLNDEEIDAVVTVLREAGLA